MLEWKDGRKDDDDDDDDDDDQFTLNSHTLYNHYMNNLFLQISDLGYRFVMKTDYNFNFQGKLPYSDVELRAFRHQP